jgi:hypothetical protein
VAQYFLLISNDSLVSLACTINLPVIYQTEKICDTDLKILVFEQLELFHIVSGQLSSWVGVHSQ